MKKLSMFAILGLIVSLGAQAQTAAPTAPAGHAVPPHVVPTNLPGVYAFTQPPPSFDPRTASSADLEAWGYPQRPAASEGPEAQVRWLEEVNPAVKRSVPQLVSRPNSYNRQAVGFKTNGKLLNATAATSGNWSGFALVNGAQPFYRVTGRWIVPTVKQAPNTCSGGWDYSSQWVGIDGASNSDLVQAGSQANVYCDIGQSITEYFPWVEWLPAPELVIYKDAATETLYPFAPGDYLIVTVTATNFSGGVSTTGTLNFQDSTQGWSIALKFTAASLGGSEVVGQDAEWIVERTEVNGSLATLPDYTADPWVSVQATDLSAATYSMGNPHSATLYNITMLDDSNNPQSKVEQFGTNAMWFYPEGSAVQ